MEKNMVIFLDIVLKIILINADGYDVVVDIGETALNIVRMFGPVACAINDLARDEHGDERSVVLKHGEGTELTGECDHIGLAAERNFVG